jgi:hypothetical protein
MASRKQIPLNWNDTQGAARFNIRRERRPERAGEVTLLGLPPDANWYWFRRAFEVDDAGWLWMASANRNRIPDASYPFEGEALCHPSARSQHFGQPDLRLVGCRQGDGR